MRLAIALAMTLLGVACGPGVEVPSDPDSGGPRADGSRPPGVDGSLPSDGSRPSGDDASAPPDAGGRTIRGCDGLGAAGHWESVAPEGRFVGAYVVDPTDTANLTFCTTGDGIFRSTDCGATWVRIDDGASQVDGSFSNACWAMVIDPVDPNVLYLSNGHAAPTGVFKSTDGGVHWDQMVPSDVLSSFIFGGFVEEIALDPTDHRHITVTPHFSCVAPHSENCMWESDDAGATWRVIENTPGMNEGGGQYMIDRDSWLFTIPFGMTWRTDDAGGSWDPVAGGAYVRQVRQADDGTWYMPSLYGVLQSPDLRSFELLPGSFESIDIGDGKIFGSRYGSPSVLWRALDDPDPDNWAPVGDGGPAQSGWLVRYDPDHRLLYSSAGGQLWRVRIE